MDFDEPVASPSVVIGQSPAGLQLSGQQRVLFEALGEMDPRLGEMYLGALAALQQSFNGERFAQSAHTLRELINKLPSSLGLASEALTERLTDRLQNPERTWQKAVANSVCFQDGGWSGEIDTSLRSALKAFHGFFTWREEHRPRRRDAMTQVVRGLDVSGRRLPERLEVLAVEHWSVTRDYFIGVCHHDTDAEEGEYLGYLDAFERFLLDRLRPRTFADFDAVDAIIEEAESAD